MVGSSGVSTLVCTLLSFFRVAVCTRARSAMNPVSWIPLCSLFITRTRFKAGYRTLLCDVLLSTSFFAATRLWMMKFASKQIAIGIRQTGAHYHHQIRKLEMEKKILSLPFFHSFDEFQRQSVTFNPRYCCYVFMHISSSLIQGMKSDPFCNSFTFSLLLHFHTKKLGDHFATDDAAAVHQHISCMHSIFISLHNPPSDSSWTIRPVRLMIELT